MHKRDEKLDAFADKRDSCVFLAERCAFPIADRQAMKLLARVSSVKPPVQKDLEIKAFY